MIQLVHDALRAKARQAAGKKPTPTVAIIDSRSVRSGEERGYAGKKVAGRKNPPRRRYAGLVALGRGPLGEPPRPRRGVLRILADEAVVQEAQSRLADSAYGRNGLPDRVNESFGWLLHTVPRPPEAIGFVVLPKRWIVERTFAWLARYRRTNRDHEKTTLSSEAFVHLAMIRIMARRLA